MASFAMRNGPYCNAKQPILQCETASFAMRNSPNGIITVGLPQNQGTKNVCELPVSGKIKCVFFRIIFNYFKL